jgi:hypothetical protein
MATLVLTAACSAGVQLPEDAQLSCGSDADCPSGFRCRTEAERCVSIDRLGDDLLAFVEAPALKSDRLSHAEGFETLELRFVLNAQPTDGPTARVDGAVDVPCAADDQPGGFGFTCALALSPDVEVEEGFHALELTAADAVGVEVRDEQRFEVDLTPPAIADDTEALVLTPGPGSELDRLDALGLGGVAQLTFAATEPLSAPPEVRAGGVSFTLLQEIGLLYVLSLEVTAGSPPDETYALDVDLVDLAGNAVTATATSPLVVDTTPPGEATVDDADAVLFARAPWGDAVDDATPRFRVTGAAGAVEPRSFVRLTASADPGALLLGQEEADDQGGFDFELLPVDVPQPAITVIDRAGNAGPPRLVRDVAWTATLGGKIAGRLAENPHALFATGTFDDGALGPNLVEEPAAVTALSGPGSVETRADRRVVEIQTAQRTFPTLFRGAFAFHRGRGNLVVFGGIDDANPLRNTNNMFELDDDDTWRPIVTATTPPPDSTHMTYDTARDRLVLPGVSGTFAFEGNDWRKLNDFAPGFRDRFGLAYDERLERAVALVNDANVMRTHVLEGDVWRELPAAPAGFPVLRPPVLGFDPASGRVILFGGSDAEAGFVGSGEIWALDDEQWTEIGAGPPRELHALVHDGARLLAIGGCPDCQFGSCDPILRVDEFDGSSFVDSGLSGLFRNEQLVGFDLDAGRVEAYTGYTELVPIVGPQPPPFEDRLFVLDGDGSREIARVPPAISPRVDGDWAFDPVRSRSILHGGAFSGFAATVLVDTWEIRDGVITQRGDSPFIRVGPLAFDGANVVAFGEGGNLMRFGGASWANVGTTPMPPIAPAIAFDVERDTALLVGGARVQGSPTAETWSFRGGTFTQLTPTTSPTARTNGQLAVEPGTGRAVLFGGCVGFCSSVLELEDTWVFEDGGWTELSTAPDETGLIKPRLLRHDGRGTVVLFATGAAGVRSWELLADAWVPLDLDPPDNLSGPATGYDVAGDRVLFQGGNRDGAITDELFSWDAATGERPAQLLRVDLSAALLSPAAQVSSLSLRARAGARGFGAVDEATPGLELLGWADQGFTALATFAGDVDAPADAAHVVTDADLLRRLLKANDTLHLAWAPESLTGIGDSAGRGGRIVTDHLAVTVRYREP